MTTTTQSPTPTPTLTDRALEMLTRPPASTPEEWTGYWKGLKALRAEGWKPSEAEQKVIDAFYRAGQKSGLSAKKPEASAPAKSAKPTKRRFSNKPSSTKLPSGKHAAMIGYLDGARIYRRWFSSSAEAFSLIDATIEALRASHDGKGSALRIVVKDFLLLEDWALTVDLKSTGTAEYRLKSAGRFGRNQVAHPVKPGTAPVKRTLKPLPPPPAPKAAKPSSGGNEAVKTALAAALQGLQATTAAIQAAIAAL